MINVDSLSNNMSSTMAKQRRAAELWALVRKHKYRILGKSEELKKFGQKE